MHNYTVTHAVCHVAKLNQHVIISSDIEFVVFIYFICIVQAAHKVQQTKNTSWAKRTRNSNNCLLEQYKKIMPLITAKHTQYSYTQIYYN